MAEELRARFVAEDDMSDALETIADSLEEVSDKFEELANAGNDIFDNFDSISEASSSLDEISSACDEASNSMSEAGDAFADAGDGATEMASSIEDAESSMDSVNDSADDMASAMDEAGSAAEEMADSADEAGEAMSDFAESTEEVADAASSISDSTSSVGEALTEVGSSAEEAGSALTSAGETGASAISALASAIGGAAIAVSLKDIASAANEMGEAFSNAQKTLVNATGATGKSLSDMSTSMLDAWRVNDESLEDAAGATGEINTRMGLTGEALTDMTAKFLDFSDITGQNVVSSVRSASQILNSWGMRTSDTEVLMDKLAYTGQKTGISVDNLSDTLVRGAGSFKAAGLSLDNTISLLGDFETMGINTTQGVMAMRTAVTKLAKSGGDVKSGLVDAIEEIANMGNASQATAKATELFGSRAGQAIALGIRNGVLSADSFNASLDDARGTLELTAEAGESLSDKWDKAFNNIKAGFTKELSPGIEAMSESLSSLANGFGDFLNNNEGAATAIASVTTGVVGATAAFAGLNAVMSAINSIQAGTGILGMLFGGISLPAFAAVAGGIGLVTGAFMEYSKHTKEIDDEFNSETPWTRATRQELESLEAQYDSLGDSQQLGSEQAQNMKLRIDELSRSLSENGESVEQLFSRMDSILNSHKGLMDNIQEQNDAFESQYRSHDAMLAEIGKGVKANEAYAGSAADLSTYFNLLNDDIGITSTSIEDFGRDSSKAFNKLRAETLKSDFMEGVKQEYENRMDLQTDLADLQAEQNHLAEQRVQAEKDLTDLQEQQAAIQARQRRGDSRQMADPSVGSENAGKIQRLIEDNQDLIDNLKEGEAEVAKSIEETNQAIENGVAPVDMLISRLQELDGVTQSTAEGYAAAGMALEAHSQQLSNLADSYQTAYDTAKQSFEGQFGLFDQAQMASGYTMQDLSKSLSSQQQYWSNYATNVGQITDWLGNQSQTTQDQYGAFMDYIATATPEAAATAYDFVKNLDEGNEQYLQDVGKQFEDLAQKRETAAKELADYQTDINDTLKEAQDQIKETLEQSDDISEQAKESGKKILDNYFDGLQESLNSGDIEGFASKLQDSFSEVMSHLFEGNGEGTEAPEKEVEIKANNADALQKLREIEEQSNAANPEMTIDANGDPAQQTADEIANNIESQNPEMNIEADGSSAQSTADEVANSIEGENPTINVDADTSSAEAEMDAATQDKETTVKVTADTSEVDAAKNMEDGSAKITVTADTSQLESAVTGALSSITGQDARITVEADTAQAEAQLQALVSTADGIQPKIIVTADTSQAQSAMGELSGLAAGLNVNIPVTSTGADQVINQLSQIQSLGESTHPVINISETGADEVISQINAIAAAGAAVSPVVITVTDNGTAAAVASQIAAIPTSKTVTVTVNEVGGSKAGHWQGTTSAESSFYAGEAGPELIVKPIAKYADGTTFSDGMYIAGENGPELITGAAGSTVFPASETNRLIEALSQPQPLPELPTAGGPVSDSSNSESESGEKHIVIDINGGGSISVSGNNQMDKDQVLNLLQENMKPVLMRIIQSEIYEEGDLSYDY